MYNEVAEPLKHARKRIFEAFDETVLSHENAKYLSLGERGAMISALLEFVDTCYNYIDKK